MVRLDAAHMMGLEAVFGLRQGAAISRIANTLQMAPTQGQEGGAPKRASLRRSEVQRSRAAPQRSLPS
eukprot:4282768-Alexandrium_andersonii.AAC.1